MESKKYNLKDVQLLDEAVSSEGSIHGSSSFYPDESEHRSTFLFTGNENPSRSRTYSLNPSQNSFQNDTQNQSYSSIPYHNFEEKYFLRSSFMYPAEKFSQCNLQGYSWYPFQDPPQNNSQSHSPNPCQIPAQNDSQRQSYSLNPSQNPTQNNFKRLGYSLNPSQNPTQNNSKRQSYSLNPSQNPTQNNPSRQALNQALRNSRREQGLSRSANDLIPCVEGLRIRDSPSHRDTSSSSFKTGGATSLSPRKPECHQPKLLVGSKEENPRVGNYFNFDPEFLNSSSDESEFTPSPQREKRYTKKKGDLPEKTYFSIRIQMEKYFKKNSIKSDSRNNSQSHSRNHSQSHTQSHSQNSSQNLPQNLSQDDSQQSYFELSKQIRSNDYSQNDSRMNFQCVSPSCIPSCTRLSHHISRNLAESDALTQDSQPLDQTDPAFSMDDLAGRGWTDEELQSSITARQARYEASARPNEADFPNMEFALDTAGDSPVWRMIPSTTTQTFLDDLETALSPATFGSILSSDSDTDKYLPSSKSASVINKKTTVYTNTEDGSDDNCPICLEGIKEKQVRELGCRHRGCDQCIMKWLQTAKRTCPVCRKEI